MKTANDFQEPIDEICSDSMYQNEITTEDVNPQSLLENGWQDLVCPVTKPIEKKANVENEIEDKFVTYWRWCEEHKN